MSVEAVNDIMQRALTEEAFRKELRDNFDQAITGYELTPEEQSAIRSMDEERLQALGLDSRKSKEAMFGSMAR